jgi:cystine transport system substrate-binding protein
MIRKKDNPMKKNLLFVKVISLVLAVVFSLSLTAATAEGGDDLLDTIKERGTLIVGTEGTWSPYTYHDESETLVGFDVEVAKLIADYIGVEIQYSETVWSSIFASLDAGQIDTVVNEVSYTEERAVKYDFSEPYTFTQRAILVLADNDAINGLEDIAGKTASNDPTSTIGQFAQDNGAVLDPVGEMAQSISEVLNGRADLTVNTTVAFADYLEQHPENEEKVKIIIVSDPAPSGYVPVLKGNGKLVAAINEALQKAREDGTLSELSLKYFGVDITKE